MKYGDFEYDKNQDYGRFQPMIDTALEFEDEVKKIISYTNPFAGVAEGETFSGIFIQFKNGFGADIASNNASYGGREGQYEIKVYDKNDEITYSTDITDDVVGFLEKDDAIDTMKDIMNLDLEGCLNKEIDFEL